MLAKSLVKCSILVFTLLLAINVARAEDDSSFNIGGTSSAATPYYDSGYYNTGYEYNSGYVGRDEDAVGGGVWVGTDDQPYRNGSNNWSRR